MKKMKTDDLLSKNVNSVSLIFCSGHFLNIKCAKYAFVYTTIYMEFPDVAVLARYHRLV